MDVKELRTDELVNACDFLLDFDTYNEYQENLKIALDTLDFALTQLDSVRDNYRYLWDKYCELLGKNTPKKVVRYSDDESDHVYCPCCNECVGSNENVYDDFCYRGWATMYCQECGQAMVWN